VLRARISHHPSAVSQTIPRSVKTVCQRRALNAQPTKPCGKLATKATKEDWDAPSWVTYASHQIPRCSDRISFQQNEPAFTQRRTNPAAQTVIVRESAGSCTAKEGRRVSSEVITHIRIMIIPRSFHGHMVRVTSNRVMARHVGSSAHRGSEYFAYPMIGWRMLWMVLGDFVGETEYSVYDRISYRKKDELFSTPECSTRVRLATIFDSALIG
jgi:hypothetical protein